MDTTHYSFNGKSWRPCPTMSDYNSFFHAAFGVNTAENGYFDKHAKFRRMYWATFLTYFENEDMPSCLVNKLMKCFSVYEKRKSLSKDEKQNLTKYISGFTADEQAITKEDIPVLATLENTKVVVLSNGEVTVIEPDPNIFGSYPKVPKQKLREVILCLEENTFARLEPVEESCPKPINSKAEYKTKTSKYKKGGSAGSKGVEYQISLLAMVILKAMKNGLGDWRLSTEDEDAAKFDDIVLEWSAGTILIQSKHKEDDKKRITLEQLMSVNSKRDDFSFPKYFLSYMLIKDKFNVKNIILCTNADVHEKALIFLNPQTANTDSLLHYDDEYSFYILNDTVIPVLKQKSIEYYNQNFQNKGIQESDITDENLADFLKQLQLFFDYPPLKALEKITAELLSVTECCNNSQGKITPLEMYSKIMDWFQQKEGVYLTEIQAKAMFAEILTEKYCHKLQHYNVSLQRNELNFHGPKQIFHVTSTHGNLLQAIKVYNALQNEKEKTLYVNPDDDIVNQKLTLEAFDLPQYVYLIIIQHKVIEECVIIEMCVKLRDILTKKKYKKIILITRNNNAFCSCIGHRDYEIIDGSVVFGDLSESTQKKLLKDKVIIFQGRTVCLEELLTTRTIEDYKKIVDSETLENIITGEVKVGVQLLEMDKNTAPFYINRTFMRSMDNMYEDRIYEVNENVVLISDSAGVGKTTVLSKLATNIKERNPQLWVIKVALTEYTNILRDLKHNEESISITKLLNFRTATKLTNRLETFVFSMEKKVVLMLDGIDEISPDYTELVLNLLTQCLQATNFAKLFVTTRPHMVLELKKILNVDPFELQPFTEQNQVDFLTAYWTHSLVVDNKKRCEQYARALIGRMSSWTKGYVYGREKFTAIALQLRMVAEIFKETNTTVMNDTSNCESCKEYLENTEVWPKLPKKIEIKKLYDMFIETKRHIYVYKGNPSGNSEANTALVKQFNESLTYHRRLALEVILKVEDCRHFSCYQEISEDMNESVLKIGIVHRSNEGFYFIHRTFAEYFVAESLVSELQLQSRSPNVNFQQFFIENVLRLSEYQIIRAFLDNFLQNIPSPIPSNIFKCYQSQSNTFLPIEYDFWVIHLLAGENCVEILRLILKCLDFKATKDETTFAGLLADISFTNVYSLSRTLESCIKRGNMAVNMFNAVKILVQDMGLDVRDMRYRTPLLLATGQGHFEMVKFLVGLGAKVDIADAYGSTALHLAARIGRVDIIKYLVDLGVEVDFRNSDGCTPLHFAAERGELDCVKYLIDSGGDATIRSNDRCTALHFAAMGDRLDTMAFYKPEVDGRTTPHLTVKKGQLAVIEFLVQLSCDINIKNKDSWTPMHFAAKYSHLDTIKLLRKLGGDLAITNSCGKMALHLAAEKGSLDSVRYLINFNEDVDIKDNDGCTSLHLAVQYGHIDTVKYLHEQGASLNTKNNSGKTALHLASEKGDLNIVGYLIKFYDDVNIKDIHGCTALHCAVMRYNFDMVKVLHELGVDLNMRNKHGKTALHLAAEYGNLDSVRYLAKSSADINVKDNNGCTPLHLAACNSLSVVKCLHELSTDLCIRDNLGNVALHLAAEKGRLDIVKFLIKVGGDLNIANDNDNTPLHLAAEKGHLDTAKYLLKAGGDPNIGNGDQKMPVHLAAEKGYLDMVKFLHEFGALLDVRDSRGRTALHSATVFERLDVVKFCIEAGARLDITDNLDRTALDTATISASVDMIHLLVKAGADTNLKDRDK